ncbi:MAG: glutamate racemase [Thermoanaerobaculia bacterium]
MATGNDVRPIGIFDSGVGGLTVFREIARALPHEHLVYLGDSARVPYGTKSPATVVRYSLEAAQHLMERNVKMMVVACNTATAAALPVLQKRLDIPVIGVIEPGARAAVAVTRGHIGVIATEGTVKSDAYRRAILALDPSLKVVQAAAPLFVPLAEEGWANTHVAREVAEIYLGPLIDSGIDTLVLGCTHYPILRATIEKVVGDRVRIVDSAETTAAAVRALIEPATTGVPEYHFLVTDAEDRFRRIAGEFLEREIANLELVVF